MSSDGQLIGTIVGAAVGAYAGAPLQGASIGAAIGGAIDPPKSPKIRSPRMSDNAEQTSSYGAPVPTINGKIATKGVIIWVEGNKKRIVVTEEEAEGGKGGGGGATTETQEAFVTCAILLADHPVNGVERIWIGGKLVANGGATDTATAAATAEVFPAQSLYNNDELLKVALSVNTTGAKIQLQPGFDDVDPHPRVEADLGAGNAPAWRGKTVLYLIDWPLADVANSIAGLDLQAELIKSGSAGSAVLLSDVTYDNTPGEDWTTQCLYLNLEEAAITSRLNDSFPAEHAAINVSQDSYQGPGGYVEFGIGFAQGWSDTEGFIDQYPLAPPYDLDGDFQSLSTTAGRVVRKNDTLYGFQFAGWLYLPGLTKIATSTDPKAMAVDDSGNIYIVHGTNPATGTSGIDKYSQDGTFIEFKHITFTDESYGNRGLEAMWDSSTGLMWIGFTGTGGSNIVIRFYALDFETEAVSSLITIDGPVDTATITSNFTVEGSVLTRHYYDDVAFEGHIDRWRLPTLSTDGQPLADVVRERMEKTPLLESTDINVTLLSGDVTGYKSSGIITPRAALVPLQDAYFFKIIEAGYQLKAIPTAGQVSVATITEGELDARPFGAANKPLLPSGRDMQSELPSQVLVSFFDAARNYNQNEALSLERISSGAVNKESFELAIVFTPEEAVSVANAQMDRMWIDREDFSFSLPQTYNQLEPSDVITLEMSYATFEFRLVSIDYKADGRLECSAKLNDATISTQNATGGSRVLGDTTISFAGKSISHLLDIPLIRDEDDKPGFAASLTGKSSGWPGGTIVRSVDNGQTFTNLQSFTAGVRAGICADSLPAHGGYTIDRTNTLTINLYNVGLTLSSITQAQMLTNPGRNWFAYGASGRWELCQYANATLNADGSYTLDTIVRGAKGTEQYTGTHEDGDLFIFLADNAAFIAANISDIDVERIYRGVTSGKSINDVADTLYTYTGTNLKTIRPTQLAGTIDGSDNWDLIWLRSSRLSSSWWTNGTDAPLGETTEAYEIDIIDTSVSPWVVARTLTATSEAVQYTSADQVTDFGSNQTSLTFRVYQISSTIGRGHVTEITL